MSEEKEALIVSSIYLYESVLRKVDVKLDEIQKQHPAQANQEASDEGDKKGT